MLPIFSVLLSVFLLSVFCFFSMVLSIHQSLSSWIFQWWLGKQLRALIQRNESVCSGVLSLNYHVCEWQDLMQNLVLAQFSPKTSMPLPCTGLVFLGDCTKRMVSALRAGGLPNTKAVPAWILELKMQPILFSVLLRLKITLMLNVA